MSNWDKRDNGGRDNRDNSRVGDHRGITVNRDNRDKITEIIGVIGQ